MVLKQRVLLLKTALWALGLTPLAWAAWRLFRGDGFGANPIAEIQLWAGLTSLTALLCALAVTPLRRLTGWNDLQKARRLVGLFAFFYVVLHFVVWVGVDQGFAWEYILEDIAERPYIMVGFAGFVLLVPLAVTSTKGWIRRLGSRWVALHRLAYAAGLLGVIHWFWITKSDDRWPSFALGVWAVLMGARLVVWLRGRGATNAARGGRTGSRVPQAPSVS